MPTGPKDMRILTERLHSPVFRKSFAYNPLSALERAGISTANIPGAVLDSLAELSRDELDTLGRISAKLKDVVSDAEGYVVF